MDFEDSFQRSAAWQKAMDLVERVYVLTMNFPSREMHGLSADFRSTAVEIPSKISEAAAYSNLRKQLHCFSDARGKLFRAKTYLLIAHRLEFLTTEAKDELNTLMRETLLVLDQEVVSIGGPDADCEMWDLMNDVDDDMPMGDDLPGDWKS